MSCDFDADLEAPWESAGAVKRCQGRRPPNLTVPSALTIGSGPRGGGRCTGSGGRSGPAGHRGRRGGDTRNRPSVPADVEPVSRPVPTRRGALPQKRAYGSDFPFRDVRHLTRDEPLGSANPSAVSAGLRGRASRGAQIMPLSKRTFDGWPNWWTEMESHYCT